MMALSTFLFLASSALVAGQRPSFAGFRPIGYPDTPNRTTTESVADRFGEDTTERLPIEANGDRDLVDRLSKLPIDKQPFWFINWQAYEEHRKKPQTFPQKPNVFIDPITSNVGSYNSGASNSASVVADSNPANSNLGGPRPIAGISNTGSSQSTTGSSNSGFVDMNAGVLNMSSENSNANSNSESGSFIFSTGDLNSNVNSGANSQSNNGSSGFVNKISETLGERFGPVKPTSGVKNCGCINSSRHSSPNADLERPSKTAQKTNSNNNNNSKSEFGDDVQTTDTQYAKPDNLNIQKITDYHPQNYNNRRSNGYGR